MQVYYLYDEVNNCSPENDMIQVSEPEFYEKVQQNEK